jgi:hypothetical protein
VAEKNWFLYHNYFILSARYEKYNEKQDILITFAALKVEYFQESVKNGFIQSVSEFISAGL